MDVLPAYRKEPFIQEKLDRLRRLIELDRAAIKTWEKSDPDYPLLGEVKWQLESGLKIWTEMTGMKACR